MLVDISLHRVQDTSVAESDISLTCVWCGSVFAIPRREFRRQVKNGRDRFFCSRSCAAKYGNEALGRKAKVVDAVCPVCSRSFQTSTRRRSPKFCSRGCASRGSVTEYRREKARQVGFANMKDLTEAEQKVRRATALRSRESWKYVLVRKLLEDGGVKYTFEFELENFVFDLALLDQRLLVEFDGKYHQDGKQQEKDREKDLAAESLGWRVARISVQENAVIPQSALSGMLG